MTSHNLDDADEPGLNKAEEEKKWRTAETVRIKIKTQQAGGVSESLQRDYQTRIRKANLCFTF